MFIINMLTALIVALVLTIGFVLLRRPRTGAILLLFFGVVFLSAWAGGNWIEPARAVPWGGAWIGFLLTGLVVAVLLSLLLPTGRARSPQTRSEENATRSLVLVNQLFWALLVVLSLVIILRYLLRYYYVP